MSARFKSLAPLLTGGLLLLSYPPYNVSWLAWIALVPLLWTVFNQSRRRLIVRDVSVAGFVWSAGIFYPLLFVEGGSWLERIVGFSAITGLLIVFLFLFSVLVRRILARHPLTMGRTVVVITSAWVGLEYVCRFVAVGFSPYMGITQWQSSWLLHVASFGGVHALSALVILFNALVFYGLQANGFISFDNYLNSYRNIGERNTGQQNLPLVSPSVWAVLSGLFFCWVLVVNGFFATWEKQPTSAPDPVQLDMAQSKETRESTAASDSWVAILVQPGFTPADYYEAAVQGWDGHDRLLVQVIDQTRKALNAYSGAYPAVVFWPETTLHIDVLALGRNRDMVADLAREFDVGLVLGIPRYIDARTRGDAQGRSPFSWLAGSPREYNSARIITPDGHEAAIYDKMYVIPIAEAQYAPGDEISPVYPLAAADGTGPAVGVGICSDVIEPGHARAAVQAGARTLHYLSALSRIGRLVELERAFLSMRAAEHRVYVTQTATTGPTIVVDPYGRVIESVESAGPTVRLVQLPVDGGATTIYTRWGDWPVAWGAVLMVTVGVGGWLAPTRTRSKPSHHGKM